MARSDSVGLQQSAGAREVWKLEEIRRMVQTKPLSIDLQENDLIWN